MKRLIYIIGGILLFMVSCTSKKSPNEGMTGDMDDNGMSRYMENNDEEGWD